MKKLLLFSAIAVMFFSCTKKEETVFKFDKTEISLHYDETIVLNIETNLDKSFVRYDFDENYVSIANGALIAHHVTVNEETRVFAFHYIDKKVSAICNVEVVPYIQGFQVPKINYGVLHSAELKVVEAVLNHALVSENANEIVFAPAENEQNFIENLTYEIDDAQRVKSLKAHLKTDIPQADIDKFLLERYTNLSDTEYFDGSNRINIQYISAENAIEFVF
ncbi:MAG: hypothetical protein LBS50_06660 [Prevotellaceae bacterium]|jgi:hypothetical protein|nr:hypothetical protein [Prevotellaceae bacterium]